MKKNVRISIIALCFFALSVSSLPATYATESRFPDMTGHWAEIYVEALADRGIIKGMDDGLFHPEEPVTTAQFVAMAMRNTYGDIAPVSAHWASGYIEEALKLEIIDAEDARNRDRSLIRSYTARISIETLQKIINEPLESDVSAAQKLHDLEACSACIEYVAQAFTKGIMIGKPDGYFYGDDVITRAEAAIVIMKILDPTMREPQVSDVVTSTVPSDSETADINTITPDEVLQLLNNDNGENALLVDVRSQEEHLTGFIDGSVCIPLPDIAANADTLLPDKNRMIILYCQKGSRTLQAYNLLIAAGYTNVFYLGGVDDWPYDIVSNE